MTRPAPGTVLCPAPDIVEGDARGFDFGEGVNRFSLFLLRKEGTLRAYVNRCPHIGTPLDWPDNRFFTSDGAYLICHTHGAQFQPEDGLCIRGPCIGKKLTPVPIIQIDGEIRLA